MCHWKKRKEVKEVNKTPGVDGITVEILSGVDDAYMQLTSKWGED